MKIKGKNAISLIVLVITILVLSILAATVIISLSNTNIISQANDAVKKTEAQQIEESKTLMYADGMLGYNPEPQTIGDTTLTWVESDQKVTAVSNKNTEKEGVTIPAGFGYVEGTEDTGLVIEDKDGNQFVWVPVEYTATGVTDENGLDTGFTAVFKTGALEETSNGIYKMTGTLNIENVKCWDEYGCVTVEFSEPYTYATSEEKEEYNAMRKSVEKYGGFYIARFEAGDGTVNEERTSTTEAHTVVSKKGVAVYNYVEVNDAISLAQNMYNDDASVVSTLCYGTQWDATLNFISDATHDISSTSWGNTGSLKRCGSSNEWQAKNIFDLAGNVSELTMEEYYYNESVAGGTAHSGRAARGYLTSYSRYNNGDISFFIGLAREDGASWLGFRVALYLK